ncbi:MAG: DUF4418 family protein [bacterium]
MKRQTIPAMVIFLLAIIAAIGSQTFLGACVHDDGSFGACHWACRALLGEGILLAVLALAAMALKREKPGLYLAMLPASLLGMLIPGTLVALCKVSTMRCRMIMRPAMMILFALALVTALVGWLLSRKGEK